jgi:pyrroline-5-carboxylate reductase
MKVGIIGLGNMGGTIAEALITSEVIQDSELVVSTRQQETLDLFLDKLPEKVIATTLDNKLLVSQADVVILAVKPTILFGVLEEIRLLISESTVLVSIVAGIEISQIEAAVGGNVKVVRAMPNVALMVNAGMTALCHNSFVTQDELVFVQQLFQSCGLVEVVKESLMDAVTAVSGSSPAYIFLIIEAMIDGAVLEGLPRQQASIMAVQSVFGAAKMVGELKEHPAVLKDKVTSPGGTTIAALAKLEATGVRDAIIESMRICVKRSREIREEIL